MEMLCRLSYVGCLNDLDVPRRAAQLKKHTLNDACCSDEAFDSVLGSFEDALPRAVERIAFAVGVGCEHGKIGARPTPCQTEISRGPSIRPPRGAAARGRGASPGGHPTRRLDAGDPADGGRSCQNIDVRSDQEGQRSGKRWSGKRDSNPRPSAWKADALPLSYSRSSRWKGREWWWGKDSNLRRLKPTDLQSVPFDRSGTPPLRFLLDFLVLWGPAVQSGREARTPRPGRCRRAVKLPPRWRQRQAEARSMHTAGLTGAHAGNGRQAPGRLSWRRDSNPQPPHYK